jgi:inner membrane protein
VISAPQSASAKAGVLAVTALVLLVPLALLSSLVTERTQERDAAVATVARGWGERQWIGAPLLAIPVTDDAHPARSCDWYVPADRVEISADVQVQAARRRLGLYDVPVYIAHVHARGQFDLARELARLNGGGAAVHPHLERARLVLPIQDPRGLRALASASSEFQNFEPSSGFPIPVLAAPVSSGADPAATIRSFDLTFDLAGTQSLGFLPLARVVRVQTHGNWPDPGFADGFLPAEHHIDDHGFSANWQILDVNRTFGDRWFTASVSEQTLLASGFGIELVQPVDIYQRCTRAVKYGGLFIALSFLTLFLVENLRRQPLHPIQYGLMGLALSVFYLLLLALAEHIGFLPAYLLATAALCALMGAYLAGALGSTRAGFASGGIFAATYTLLYMLVTSESYALLAGALALFALLATAMLLTRRMDWYAQSD